MAEGLWTRSGEMARDERRFGSVQRHLARTIVALTISLAISLTTARSVASACPYSIRDAAFLAAEQPSPFALYIAVDGAELKTGGREEIDGWLDAARASWLDPAGIRARVVVRQADDDADWRALDPAVLAALGEGPLPAAVLVSPDSTAIVLERSPELRLDATAVAQVAERAVSSPTRERLRGRLPEAWCLGLLVEGSDRAANAAARAAFEEAARSLSGRETELGKTISAVPELITVPPPGTPAAAAERVLLWSQGLETPREQPRLVLLTGRAERRAELLEGGEIRAGTLVERFEMLGRSCSCTTSPTWLSGPRVPLRWTTTEKEAVRRHLGFDPDDPEVVRSIRAATGSGQVVFEDVGLGYSEISLGPLEPPPPAAEGATTTPVAREGRPGEPETATPPAESGPDARVSAPGPSRPQPDGRPGGQLLLVVLALGAAAVAVVTALVVRRARRPEQSAPESSGSE